MEPNVVGVARHIELGEGSVRGTQKTVAVERLIVENTAHVALAIDVHDLETMAGVRRERHDRTVRRANKAVVDLLLVAVRAYDKALVVDRLNISLLGAF